MPRSLLCTADLRLRRGTRLSALLTVLLAGPSLAQQSMPEAVQACLGAESEAGWARIATEWATPRETDEIDEELRDRLLELGARDQALRSVPNFADSIRSPDFARRLASADSLNAEALMRFVASHGWPRRSRVGADAADAAFLVAQHNPSIQESSLAWMLELPQDEVSQVSLAMLRDRVLVSRGDPQLYGTQLDAADDGRTLHFSPIMAIEDLDERRAAVGLFSLDAYICFIRATSGLDVVDPRKR